ncbi:lymphocyte activation 3 protein-like, partial [Clarias magur]
MAQAYGKVHVLLLLATAMAISTSNCVRPTEVFVASGSVAVLPCVMSYPVKHSTAVTWKRIMEKNSEERTVWRRDKSGLEFRPVGQAPHATCPYSNFGNSEFSLHIEGTREEDAGMYLCEVDGQNIKKVMLYVIKISFTPAVVFEGDQLTLSCAVTPQTQRMIRKWELNGSPTPIQRSLPTYTINEVSQKDAGTWSCLIRQQERKVNVSISVQVKGILIPRDTSEVVYAALGSSVTLPCIFSKELFVNTVYWEKVSETSNQPANSQLFSNTSVSFGDYQHPSGLVDRSLFIQSVQDGDNGTYRCQVKRNGQHGNMERNIQLVTAQILTSKRNGNTVLTCRISSPSQITGYEWIYVEYGKNDTQTFTSVQKSTSNVLKVPKDKHQRLGEWMCCFYNQNQLLGNVTYHLQMMSGLEGEQKSTSGTKVATIIGLCFLFLLLALILLQLYKNNRR